MLAANREGEVQAKGLHVRNGEGGRSQKRRENTQTAIVDQRRHRLGRRPVHMAIVDQHRYRLGRRPVHMASAHTRMNGLWLHGCSSNGSAPEAKNRLCERWRQCPNAPTQLVVPADDLDDAPAAR